MPTTFIPGAFDGVTTGTTPVTIAAAPVPGVQRIVKTITVWNNDTQARMVTIRYLSGSNNRVITKQMLQASTEGIIFGGDGEILVLDATNKSLTMLLDSAPLANQLDWTVSFGDYSST